jgi:hypothetical protein
MVVTIEENLIENLIENKKVLKDADSHEENK